MDYHLPAPRRVDLLARQRVSEIDPHDPHDPHQLIMWSETERIRPPPLMPRLLHAAHTLAHSRTLACRCACAVLHCAVVRACVMVLCAYVFLCRVRVLCRAVLCCAVCACVSCALRECCAVCACVLCSVCALCRVRVRAVPCLAPDLQAGFRGRDHGQHPRVRVRPEAHLPYSPLLTRPPSFCCTPLSL